MDNLLNQAGAIKSQGAFFLPIAGDRKLPSCATRDIADAPPGCCSTTPSAARSAVNSTLPNQSEEAVGLERGGFVSRGPDPADSRRNRLEITAAGRTLLAQLEGSFRAMQDELLVSLSPEDRVELSRLLALIAVPTPAPTLSGRER
jgi:hypothetical protein